MNINLFRLGVQTVISLGLLGSGVFILVTTDWKTSPELGAIAAGWIGAVLGYWMN